MAVEKDLKAILGRLKYSDDAKVRRTDFRKY